MKKLMLIIFLAGTFTYLSAQNDYEITPRNFSIGPMAGVNFANSDNESTSNATGLILGLTSTYSINETSGLGVALLYTQQGFEFGGIDVRANYVKVPIMYKLFFNDLGEAFRPKLSLGLSPGFLVNAKSLEAEVTPSFNKFETGIIGGVGFNYRIGNRVWLNADVRADLGLTKLSDGYAGLGELKNRSVGIVLGVAYGL